MFVNHMQPLMKEEVNIFSANLNRNWNQKKNITHSIISTNIIAQADLYTILRVADKNEAK